MSKRQFATETPATTKANPVKQGATLDNEGKTAADYALRFQGKRRAGSAPRPEAQAAGLTQASGGQLVRAGNALLQLQRGFGNRYVQQVVSHARPADGVAQRVIRSEQEEVLQSKFAPVQRVGQHTDGASTEPVVQRSVLQDHPLEHKFSGTTRKLADQIELDRSAEYYRQQGWGEIIILGSDGQVETNKPLAIVAHGSAKGEFSSYKTGQALAVAVMQHHGVIPGMKIALEGCYSEHVIAEFGDTIDKSALNEQRKFTTVAGNIGVQFDVDQEQYTISDEGQENRSQQEYMSYRDEKLKEPEEFAVKELQKVTRQLPDFQQDEAQYIQENLLLIAEPAGYTPLGDWLSRHRFDARKFAGKKPADVARKLKKAFGEIAGSKNITVWGELIKALHNISDRDLANTPVLKEFRAELLSIYQRYREAVGFQVHALMQALKPYSDQEQARKGNVLKGRLIRPRKTTNLARDE